MKFDKSKSISKDNRGKIYLDKVETDESIMIDEEYIFLDSIKTEKEIVITKKTIVLGDIECNFLNVIDELTCYGNIKANTIFTNIDIECYKEAFCNNVISGKINIIGNSYEREVIREVEKVVEVVKEVNPFDNFKIDMENIYYPLSIIDDFKDQIIKYADEELIFLEEDVFISELEKIGLTFLEFKNDSEFLKQIKKYANLNKIITLKEYLEFLKIIKNAPSWLEGIDLVEGTIDKLMIYSFEDLKELELNLKDKEDVLKVLSDIVYCKNELNGNYSDLTDWIISAYKRVLIIPEDMEENDTIEEQYVSELAVDVRDLYEEYIWKKGSLLECKVKSIKNDYLELCEVSKPNNKLSIIMNTNETSKYTVGQTILGCILKVYINEEKLNIEVVNDSDNMPRLIFKHLSARYGLSNSMIQNFSRVKGKSTCIVIALSPSIANNDKIKIECKNIESQMKNYLNGEDVNVFIYDKDPIKFAANILDINQSNIKINKELEKCIVNNIYIPDENRVNNLLDIQKENLKKVFKYNFEIEIKNI